MKAEQLRKSILQYAIQGKLVPQIDTEEPASVLLKKIKAEKQELIKQGKIKKEKTLPSITDEEKPFEIPDSWEWVRFSDIANLFTGNSINAQEKKNKYTNLLNGYNYIATKDVSFNSTIDYNNGIKIPFETNFKIASQKSSLLCIEGGSAGRKVAILNQDVCFGNKLCCFEPYIVDHDYLFYYLQSPIFTENFTSSKSGMIGGVGVNTLKTLLFALPPLAEQQRIVTRIEELMAFVDEYEKKEIELSKLEKEFPEKLKKSILQYAIQGKLVPQIDTEESASELLKKIQQEKQELIKLGKIKKQKDLPPITDDEKPFEIPDSWEWTSINEISFVTKLAGFEYTEHMAQNIKSIGDVPIVRAQHVKMNEFTSNQKEFISLELSYKLNRCSLNKKCILMTFIGAGIGDVCIFNNILRHHLAPNVAKIEPFVDVNKYLLYYLMSDTGRLGIFEYKKSTAQPSLSMATIRQVVLPIPPLAEQQRIVARIEELFSLVDILAEGKKLKTKEGKTALKVIENVIELKPHLEVKKRVDVSSFGLVARNNGEVTQCDLDTALSEVQDFYDKKKD